MAIRVTWATLLSILKSTKEALFGATELGRSSTALVVNSIAGATILTVSVRAPFRPEMGAAQLLS